MTDDPYLWRHRDRECWDALSVMPWSEAAAESEHLQETIVWWDE